jgi:uncharacterized protein YecE (DUF72 family)
LPQKSNFATEPDDFLAMAEVEAMLDLIEGLPMDKQKPILNQMMSTFNKTPDDVEQIFSRYYTRTQMKEAVITRTKKWITKKVVEPHRKKLTPVQRDSILALLEKLTY